MAFHVAVIGCGKRLTGKEGWAIGHAHATGWLGSGKEVVLYGVDPSPENLGAFAEAFHIPPERCFPSTQALYGARVPDAVSICTWPKLHGPQCLEAVAAGVKGILCEKPLATDPATMSEMENACREKGVALAVAHQRRYEPWFESAREEIGGGAIGGDRVLEARVGDGWDILSWTVHWFDMAHYLLGSHAVRILAGGDVGGQVRYQHPVENSSVIFAEYGDGSQGIFITGPEKKGPSITVRGSRGFLELEPGKYLKVWNETGCRTVTPVSRPRNGFAHLMGDLLAQMEGGPTTRCDVTEGAKATEVAFAAQESLRTRRAVSLPLQIGFAPLEILAYREKPRAFPYKKAAVITDGHFGSGGPEGLMRVLAGLTGAEVTRIDADTGLTEGAVKDLDFIAVFHTAEVAGKGTKVVLTRWVQSGKPLFIAHGGLGAWRHWTDFHSWCGRIWEWGKSSHPHEPSTLQAQVNWKTNTWTEAWLPKDEIFMDLKPVSPVMDLMDVHMSKGPVPGAWVNKAKPNVRVWVPGHRGDLWDLEPMASGIRALWQWVGS